MNHTEYMRNWRKNNPDKLKENKKKYREKHKEYLSSWFSKYYKDNKEKLADYQKRIYKDKAEYLRELRLERKNIVFSHYGWKCNCCGESEHKFLSIDHVNNDGYKERKGRGGSSDIIYRKIIIENFPDTYQVLCYNCNLGKARNNGICPHNDYDTK